MRKDMIRIKASQVRLGNVLAFVNPLMDEKVSTIYKDGKEITFNEAHKVKASEFVFIQSFDGLEALPVEAISLGEFVKRDPNGSKVYKRGAYDASSKTYALDDVEDISRAVYVKKGSSLFVGFTY